MDRATIDRCAQMHIFWITPCIAQGRFPTPERRAELHRSGVTHLLNVSDAPMPFAAADSEFAEVESISINDLERIPAEVALRCVKTLHRMLLVDGSRVYIHCTAGQNRSPTILWLYLVACGVEPEAARQMIESKNFDAVAGHKTLCDPTLVETVRQHGATHFQPQLRPESVTPI
jgi:hypothetical protein